MRPIAAVLIVCCLASFSHAQYVETTIVLPDSVSALAAVGSLVFHSPTNTIYLGGSDSAIVAVDGRTNSKLKRIIVGAGPHALCSDPAGNKVYCTNVGATVTVIDGATNQPIKTLSVQQAATDIVCSAQENKLYLSATEGSYVRVIDCVGDSLLARIYVGLGPGALCYNPQLNRVYCAHQDRDEVTVIDCAADTVVSTVWVRGVEPVDICYDSATNSVYTANSGSGSVSVIDCAADTLLRLAPVGREPRVIAAGPAGKVYCANYGDGTVSTISDVGVKSTATGQHPNALCYDLTNNKVYCTSGTDTMVAVIDAANDSIVAQVVAGATPLALCCNPAGNNTYVACRDDDVVSVIGGVSDTVEAVITFGVCYPGPLCYSTTNNHLYCLDRQSELLFIIDGDSNRVLKALEGGSAYHGSDTLIWNPVSNKVYITNGWGGTVLILDCASDSIIAVVATGYQPRALCCSDDGKVYVARQYGGVTVIDGSGDTVRSLVPTGGEPWSLCYDRFDNKAYVARAADGHVSVIDVSGDSLVATISIPGMFETGICWNPNHDKAYVSGSYCDTLAVIDCKRDTLVREFDAHTNLYGLYSDSVCDKVYGFDSERGYLRVFSPSADTAICNLSIGIGAATLDNGKRGPANRLYCAVSDGRVAVVAGYKMDSILRYVTTGASPRALAWNPAYSRVYVSNYGSSSITVIRDTLSPGVEEGEPQVSSRKQQATVVRGILLMPEAVGGRRLAVGAQLLDISGRKVMDLRPGANDVRALAPGVYFLCEEPQAASRKPQAVRKVILTE